MYDSPYLTPGNGVLRIVERCREHDLGESAPDCSCSAGIIELEGTAALDAILELWADAAVAELTVLDLLSILRWQVAPGVDALVMQGRNVRIALGDARAALLREQLRGDRARTEVGQLRAELHEATLPGRVS